MENQWKQGWEGKGTRGVLEGEGCMGSTSCSTSYHSAQCPAHDPYAQKKIIWRPMRLEITKGSSVSEVQSKYVAMCNFLNIYFF